MAEQIHPNTADYVANYLQGVLEDRTAEAKTPDGEPILTYGAGQLAPTFLADAPWRLESGLKQIPFTFVIRDAEKDDVKMRLTAIEVWEAPDDGKPWDDKAWQLVHEFFDGLGDITKKYWTYRPVPSVPLGPPPTLPLTAFKTHAPGKRLLLEVVFRGSRLKPIVGRRKFEVRKRLVILIASESLPLRNTSQWYYGDTHYHSSYTNDVKEYGNPVPDTRAAAEAIGLDWLVITDHSVDLEDGNPYWEDRLTQSRWDDLGLEISKNSDERVRLLRGEEVTLLGQPGKGDDTLHMLVFGAGFDKLVPGAFAKESLFADVAIRLNRFTADLYKHLFGAIYRLEEVLTGVDQAGQATPALKGRAIHTQGALAFAAHPASFAQAPGGTWEFYDLTQPIHGMEAWNGRIRFHAAKEELPFENWKKAKVWAKSANRQGIEMWDQLLQQKVELADPRFVLLAGSDAHGGFNYSEGWWIDWNGLRADDNCLGKVRTLLYLPHRGPNEVRYAPTEAEVTAAIRTGSCVITDGPVVKQTLVYGGKAASLGDIITLEGNGTLDINIQAAWTEELGQVKQVRVIYYIQGMDTPVSKRLNFKAGRTLVLDNDLPSGPGYVRLETTTHNGDEDFRCLTNPTWIKVAGSGMRQLTVTFSEW